MRMCYCGSYVCSSDLISRWCRHEAVRDGVAPRRKPVDREPGSLAQQRGGVGICVPVVEQRERRRCERHDRVRAGCARGLVGGVVPVAEDGGAAADRTSVGEGKSVSVSVDLGGRGINNKKK